MVDVEKKLKKCVESYRLKGKFDRKHKKLVARGLRQSWWKSYHFPEDVDMMAIVQAYDQFGDTYKEKTA